MTVNDNGWDSRAWLDGEWLHREPRREVHRGLLLGLPEDVESGLAEIVARLVSSGGR